MNNNIESLKYEIEREIHSLENIPGDDLETRKQKEIEDYGFSITDKSYESQKVINHDFSELIEAVDQVYENAKERYSLLNANFTDEEIEKIKQSDKANEIIKKLVCSDAIDISFKLSSTVNLLKKVLTSLINAEHYYELIAQSNVDIKIDKDNIEKALTNPFVLEREVVKNVIDYKLENNMDTSHEQDDLKYYDYVIDKINNLSVIDQDRFKIDKKFHKSLLWEWTDEFVNTKDA